MQICVRHQATILKANEKKNEIKKTLNTDIDIEGVIPPHITSDYVFTEWILILADYTSSGWSVML